MHLYVCSWQYPVERGAGVDAFADSLLEVGYCLRHRMTVQPCKHPAANIGSGRGGQEEARRSSYSRKNIGVYWRHWSHTHQVQE